jgi:hypothetical protein
MDERCETEAIEPPEEKVMENITVGALKKLVKGLSDDTLVVIAVDPEGNSFRPVVDHTLGLSYDEDSMDVGLAEVSEADKRLGYTDEDIVVDGEACILLWPR